MTTKLKLKITIHLLFILVIILISNCKKDDVGIDDKNIIYDTLFDIDGNEYKTVRIGKQEWMAENLRSTKFNDGTSIVPNLDNDEWLTSDYASYSVYPYEIAQGYNSHHQVIHAFGLLYNGYASGNEKLCPAGWHLPTIYEWSELSGFLGGNAVAGGKLKEAGKEFWYEPNTAATNEVGFNGRPGGSRGYAGSFGRVGERGYWWSSTLSDSPNYHAYSVNLDHSSSNFGTLGLTFTMGLSVRCFRPIYDKVILPSVSTYDVTDLTKTSVKISGLVTRDGGGDITSRGFVLGNESNPDITTNAVMNVGSGLGSFEYQISGLEPNTTYYLRAFAKNSAGTGYGEERVFKTYGAVAISDIDGNHYDVVPIGKQTWLKENLIVKHFNNGDPIISNLDNQDWNSTNSGSYTVYPHRNIDGITNEKDMISSYGILYNWYAVADERGLCPEGFRVPGKTDWEELYNYVASYNSAGIGHHLKSTRQINFSDLSTLKHPRWDCQGGTDKYGFSALPAGNRNSGGSYSSIGKLAWWWSADSEPHRYENGYTLGVECYDGSAFIQTVEKSAGFNVRCLKDD